MTDEAPDQLDVPVRPVERASRGRGRAAVAAFAIVTVVGVAIGLGNLGRADVSTAAAPSPRFSPAGSGEAAPPSASPVEAAPSAQDLPEFGNEALVGAPRPVLVVRDEFDAELLGWSTGSQGLESVGSFPGAFRPAEDGAQMQLAWPSPDLASLVVTTLRSPTGRGIDDARLATREGTSWTAKGVSPFGGVAWSPTSDRFVVAAGADRWLVVGRDGAGEWAQRDLDVSIGRPPEAPSATPEPALGSIGLISPLGFTESGEWILGSRFDGTSGSVLPAVRVSAADGTVQRLDSFPLAGPDGPADPSSYIVDVTTGRSIVYGPNADIPGGPPQLEIHEPDGEYAFGVRSSMVAGWRWTGDGRLVVLGADGAPFPSRWTVMVVDPDGGARVLLEAPRAAYAGLLGIRDGYLGLTFTGADVSRYQLVVASLDGEAASAITLGEPEAETPLAAAWMP